MANVLGEMVMVNFFGGMAIVNFLGGMLMVNFFWRMVMVNFFGRMVNWCELEHLVSVLINQIACMCSSAFKTLIFYISYLDDYVCRL